MQSRRFGILARGTAKPQYEWIAVDTQYATVHSQPPVTITLVDPKITSPQAIKELQPEAISLNCEKETVVGMKNYDLWNDLLETLDIW